jgi:hypothetical protein
MNDQAILEKIAQHPQCRAVQLADWIDSELDDVQAVLAGLIAVGDVVASNGTSPAGAPCQLYELSDQFKASEAYKPIFSKVVAAQFAAAHADLSKVDRAIEFVRERGTASSAELHAVLQLPASEYVSSYLNGALKSGRLVKDGKSWTLGPAAEQTAPVPASAGSSPVVTTAESKPTLAVPTFLPKSGPATPPAPARPPRPAPAKDVAPASAAAPVYRCALWSDGVLEVRRDGQTVAELPQAAGESLAAFLGRLAGAGVPA